MTPHQHIPVDMLMSYAAGALDEPVAAVTAAHLDWCPKCRARLARMEILGGLMMERVPPATITSPADLATLAADRKPSGASEIALEPGYPRTGLPLESYLPMPIARRTGLKRATIPWSADGHGVERHTVLATDTGKAVLQFVRVAPGRALPQDMGSAEALLVLWGSFANVDGEFISGDFAGLAEGASHSRIAGNDEGCTYLVAIDAASRKQSAFSRIVGPLLGR